MSNAELDRPVKYKDPGANLDYSFDWEDWLAVGETISTSSWSVSAGITKGSETDTDTTTTVWLTGGTAGTAYTITCTVTTSTGRIDDRSMTIKVINR